MPVFVVLFRKVLDWNAFDLMLITKAMLRNMATLRREGIGNLSARESARGGSSIYIYIYTKRKREREREREIEMYHVYTYIYIY